MRRRPAFQQGPGTPGEPRAYQRLAGEVVAVGVGGFDGRRLVEALERLVLPFQADERPPPEHARLDRAGVVLEPAAADLHRARKLTGLEQRTRQLDEDARAALQYAASEGFGPLREMVAERLPWDVDPGQVLITTGSQQGLDLVAKILIDDGSKILVETPTYLGALQAFTPMEPEIVAVDSDAEGVLIEVEGAGAETFADALRASAPPLARIDSVEDICAVPVVVVQ